jgi:iron complex outermembrane receptor protein
MRSTLCSAVICTTVFVVVFASGAVVAQNSEEMADEAPADAVAEEGEGEAPDGRAPRTRSRSIEEIVVTAQKREESLQEVPISITALTSEFVLDSGLTTFDGIAQYTPNVSITPITDTRGTAIRIRGIGSDQTNAGIDSSVGVFLDGIYQGRTGLAASSDLADIERIEVLRGPQGTLYGKNTAAGAINIWTKKPVLEEFEGMIEGLYGDYNQRELRGTINFPVYQDKVAARLTGYVTRRDFFDENRSGTGRNDADKNGVKLRTLFDVTDDLEIIVSADYATSQSASIAMDIITYEGPPNLDVVFGEFEAPDRFLVGSLEETTGRPLAQPVDPFDRLLDADEQTKDSTQIWGVSLEMNYDLGDFSLKSLTAHREFDSDSLLDGDFSSYDAVFLLTDESFQQWSTELQLLSPGGERLEYVLGLYFYYSEDETNGKLGIGPEWIEASPVAGPAIALGTDENGDAFNNDTNTHETWSYAFFGQGTYRVTDTVSVTAGLRGTYERKKIVGSQIATFELEAGIFGPPRFLDDDFDVFNLSPLGVLQYQPTDDIMLFTKVARGFKSGGFNQQRTVGGDNIKFDDEEATDVEVGFRTSWLDRMLTANATFFYTWYDDFQAQAFDGTGFNVTNAGSLTSYGIEADVLAVPIEPLVIGANMGWNVAEYDEFDSSPCTAQQNWEARLDHPAGPLGPVPCVQDLSGERLDNAPRWTTSLFSQFIYPLGDLTLFGEQLLGRLRGEYSYRDFIFLQQDLDPNLTQGPVHLLNFRVGLFPDNGLWDLTLWTTNVLDEEWLVVGVDVPIVSGFAGVVAPPRQYGATLRFFW